MIAELESRRERTAEKIRAAEKLMIRVRQLGMDAIPHDIPPREKVRQIALFQDAQ